MKGFKDSNNKFHPITQSKGVRKSRDQKVKQEGVRMKRGTKIKNLTTERLRKFKGDTIFYDLDGKEYDVDTLWEILEGEGFDNDTQRNNWLKAKFGNVIENEPVPFGKIKVDEKKIDRLSSLWRRAENRLAEQDDEGALILKDKFMEEYKKLSLIEKKVVDSEIEGFGG
ncbi:MAG: hypothetical protein KJI69_05520 [Patescibacteria group bacterium]|nr:hypothetical protein [Patescibacteria group bacterium]